MALNLAHLNHNRSTSASSSHSASSAANNLYDLGYNPSAAAAFSLNRPLQQQPHTRNPSSASFATHITSPADSPPDLALASLGASSHYAPSGLGHVQSVFKRPHSSSLSRRSRAGSSPYQTHSRTPDDFPSAAFSTSSRSSDSCSDADQDDISMYFNPHQQQHGMGGLSAGGQGDYSGLFVAPPPQPQQHQPYGIHPHQLGQQHFVGGSVSPLDSSPAFGAVNLSSEAQLEQLAANVRSSTTTTASDRAKQVFVQAWLSANYAPYPDGNVPRQGLYNSYRRVCDFYNIPHINTATLGKAIRLCFPAIKTRRLGVRGNSKYHYCGIRPATVAEAEFLQDFVRRTTNHQAIAASSRRGAAAAAAHGGGGGNSGGNGSDEEDDDDSEVSSSGLGGYPGDTKDPSPFSFNGSTLQHHHHAPAPLSTVPHPLTLGGGLKSPTLFSILGGDDKTPTTNSLLSMAQAQSLSSRSSMLGVPAGGTSGAGNGTGSNLTYGVGHAQIRSRRGLGSTDSSASAGGAAGGRPSTTSGGAPGFVNGPSPMAAPAPIPISVRTLTHFPNIDEALGVDSSLIAKSESSERPSSSSGSPSGGGATTSPQHLAAIEVWRWFEDHLDGLLESVRGWRFDQFEIHVRTFWSSLSGDYREVVHAPAVAGLVVRADAVVYDEILEMLRNQMLSPIPPHALTSLRQLAEKMEKILLLSLEGYGSTFVEPKVELGARFGHLVLRFLDMFQVTQALTSVLSNAQQLADMRRSWSEIDFESVRNQSALVCNCRHEDLVQLLEHDFVQVLDGLVANANLGGVGAGGVEPVREVMNWADLCCERLMGGGVVPANGEEKSSMSSRSVLIRWGYVTSQIMRDLTIRSDPAFGAFQILKLFMDDWIALNVLRSVALSTNSVQASVEPVMQHQYLALSPMPGQEFTGGPNSSSSGLNGSITAQLMDHTPTTSSMLAALHDSYTTGQQQNGNQSSGRSHPLSHSTTSAYNHHHASAGGSSFYTDSGAAGGGFGDFNAGSFDMSFLNDASAGHETEGQSPAAQSVGSSASIAELAAGVAAAGVGSDAGGRESPSRRRPSNGSASASSSASEVKREAN